MRQRAQKQSQQRLGRRRRRDRLHREARAADQPRSRHGRGLGRAGGLQRAQGSARRRATRGHRAQSEARAAARRTAGAVRRQRGGAAEQQARDAGHAHRRGRQRGPADEGVGKDSEPGTQGEHTLRSPNARRHSWKRVLKAVDTHILTHTYPQL